MKIKFFSVNRLFLQRLWTLFKVLNPSIKSTTLWLTCAVLVISIIDQVLTYFVGLLPSQFLPTMGTRDINGYYVLMVKATLLILVKALTLALISYTTWVLYLKWRRRLGTKLHQLYFKRLTFYKINVLSDEIDNPDQRMTQDVEKTTRLLATEIMAPVLLFPFVTLYYTYKTYSSTGYLGPLVIYVYFVIGTIVSKLLLGPVVNLVVQQEKREGDFRYKHVSVRSNAEAIAFYRSGRLENDLTDRQLKKLITTQQRLVNWQFFLNSVECDSLVSIKKAASLGINTKLFDYFGSVISYLIMAIPIFLLHSYDHIEKPADLIGIISANSFFYMYLVNCFSKMIDLSNKIGDLAGVTHRVVELLEELRKLRDDMFEIREPTPLSDVSVNVTPGGGGRDRKAPGKGLLSADKGYQHIDPPTYDECEAPLPVGTAADVSASNHSSCSSSIVVGGFTNRKRFKDDEEYDDSAGARDSSVIDAEHLQVDCSDDVAFSLENVTYALPSDPLHTLISELSIQIRAGCNILVTGDSSSGKTSILRVLAGLWQCNAGEMETLWPLKPNKVLFLPQKPYFPNRDCSLRQQITYPLKATHDANDQNENKRLADILQAVKLDGFLVRCGDWDTEVDWDWHEALSPGELQRLSLARVLYHRPKLAMLDEATSAVGFELERTLYGELQKAGVSYVSVGHRLSLRRYHDYELHLDGHGGWQFSELDRSQASRPESLISSTGLLCV